MHVVRKVGLCAAALTLGVVAATPAVASGRENQTPVDAVPSGDIPAAEMATLEAQRPLVEAADRVESTVEGGADDGYAGVVLDEDHVTVWWKGDLPAAVRDTVTEVERTTPVEVAAAAYSRAELEAVAERITAFIRAHPDGPYFGTTIAYNGSGVRVLADEASAGPETATLPAEIAQAADGLPVTVAMGSRLTLMGRWDDSRPYSSGGLIYNVDPMVVGGRQCTAGWPVYDLGTLREYILTAGHCGRPGAEYWNGDRTRLIGNVEHENVPHDVMLIRASISTKMWDGGPFEEFRKRIKDVGYVAAHSGVCTSGAITGVHCYHYVGEEFAHSMCQYDAYDNFECYYDLVLARSTKLQNPGDSGGPVFIPVGLTDTGSVRALGTITGEATVDGVRNLVFQDLEDALDDFDVNLATPSDWRLQNEYTGKCLVVRGYDVGALAVQYQCEDFLDQNWEIDQYGTASGARRWEIRNRNSDLCLAIPSWNGYRPTQVSCDLNYADQRWIRVTNNITDGVQFKNEYTGRCLFAQHDGYGVSQWDCNAQWSDQRWDEDPYP